MGVARKLLRWERRILYQHLIPQSSHFFVIVKTSSEGGGGWVGAILLSSCHHNTAFISYFVLQSELFGVN